MACLLKTFLGIFVRQKKKWQIKSAFGRDNLGKANEKNANGNPRYQQCLQFSCFGHVNNMLYIIICYVIQFPFIIENDFNIAILEWTHCL